MSIRVKKLCWKFVRFDGLIAVNQLESELVVIRVGLKDHWLIETQKADVADRIDSALEMNR